MLVVHLLSISKEGPRRTSMLASLLTQLLGKVAEAKLMHAKAYNLPMFVNKLRGELTCSTEVSASYVVNLLSQSW